MSNRLEQLAARRRMLQAQCSDQRAEIAGVGAAVGAGAARVDQAVVLIRRLGPFVLAAGVVVAVAVGPRRLLGFARQALPAALLVGRAMRLLR
jgi:hypothetical protein